MIWHSSSLAQLQQELRFDAENGLNGGEVAERIQQYGQNRLSDAGVKGFWPRVLKQFAGPLPVALLVTAVVLLITNLISHKGGLAPLLFLVLVAVSALLSAYRSHKAEQSLARGKGMLELKARVLREGETQIIDAALLVPGDIVLVQAGDYIPADGRLLEASTLICDESAISGDDVPCEKQADATPEDIAPVAARQNMVYSGCSVLFGSGRLVVTDTGMHTELGRKISLLEQTVGSDLNIKQQLRQLAGQYSVCALVVCLLLFLIGIFFTKTGTGNFSALVLNVLLNTLTLAFTALPGMVVSTVAVGLAFGAARIWRNQAIVKNLRSVETLGCVSVILADKTGTLTQNSMRLSMVYDGTELVDISDGDPGNNARTLIRTGALCCNGRVTMGSTGREHHVGDPTETAIVAGCLHYCQLSKDDIENMYPRMSEIPFDSDRQLMTTVNMINNRPFAIVRGSVDLLLSKCTAGNLKGAADAIARMEEQGMRVIAVAIKALSEVPAHATPELLECDLSLLGILGLRDTVRQETRTALQQCRTAGVRTVMITGEHITAAAASAKEMGILKGDDRAVTGEDLREMSDEELAASVDSIAVFSRVSAEDKLRVIQALRKRGKVVAMTGDSVHDAAALKAADVGFAMGIDGTDIAKGSSDVILKDDSFAAAVNALWESRGIHRNIRHMAQALMSISLSQLLIMLFGLFIFHASPLNALQMLWLNTLVLYVPILLLGAEPADPGLMRQPPRHKKESLLFGAFGITALWQGVLAALLTLLAFGIGNAAEGIACGGAMAFAAFGLTLLVTVFTLRLDGSVFTINPLRNSKLLLAWLAALVLLLLVPTTPLAAWFGMAVLSGAQVGQAVLLSLVPLAVSECIWLIRYLRSR